MQMCCCCFHIGHADKDIHDFPLGRGTRRLHFGNSLAKYDLWQCVETSWTRTLTVYCVFVFVWTQSVNNLITTFFAFVLCYYICVIFCVNPSYNERLSEDRTAQPQLAGGPTLILCSFNVFKYSPRDEPVPVRGWGVTLPHWSGINLLLPSVNPPGPARAHKPNLRRSNGGEEVNIACQAIHVLLPPSFPSTFSLFSSPFSSSLFIILIPLSWQPTILPDPLFHHDTPTPYKTPPIHVFLHSSVMKPPAFQGPRLSISLPSHLIPILRPLHLSPPPPPPPPPLPSPPPLPPSPPLPLFPPWVCGGVKRRARERCTAALPREEQQVKTKLHNFARTQIISEKKDHLWEHR